MMIQSTVHEMILNAMILWEGVLEMPATEREWWTNKYGYYDARSITIDIAPLCRRAYDDALNRGYEECFDWEWVPCWLEVVRQRCINHKRTAGYEACPKKVAARTKEISEQIWPSREAA